MIAYSIFSLYRNTKIIHSIMMIWQNNFIESNYKLASGPPKDPGGVKNIFSRSKGHWFIEFSPKNQAIRPVSKRVVFVFSFFVLYLPQEIVYFLPKREKIGMMSVIWWDNLGKYTGNNFAYNKEKVEIHKLRWERKKVIILSGFSRSSGYEGCQSCYCSNGFQLFDLERGSLCCKVS